MPEVAKATRMEMIDALMVRFDLLPSHTWPWTTDVLREAYAKLKEEETHGPDRAAR